MLARRVVRRPGFTRRDGFRLLAFASVLVAVLSVILSLDVLPTSFRGPIGDIAPADLRAPRTALFESDVATDARRVEARRQVAPQYDFTLEGGAASAVSQLEAFEEAVAPVDAAYDAVLEDDARREALEAALPYLSSGARTTLGGLDEVAWTALRGEMVRVLETVQRQEVRDSQLANVRGSLRDRVSIRFDADARALAGEILAPLVVPNSSFDQAATEEAREAAATSVETVRYTIREGELLVQRGQRIDDLAREKLEFFGLLNPGLDPARISGWVLLAVLLVGLLLGWVWRFRPELWHRNNALVLVGLVLVVGTLMLKLTGDRSILAYAMPVAAGALLLAVLLDAGSALLLLAALSVFAGAITSSMELATFVFLGGLGGIILVRRGERLAHFVQAAVAMALVNLAVVTIFTLLGERDLAGVLQLWGASVAAAGGSAVAAAGTFAVLGNVFGITTSFQLLELANPSHPLLRRLLLETPGTYHHSLMVGNLAERAAEAIGADALLARAAAYYHDIGKLANPMAFIENQAGLPNPHDELTPEESATLLKTHVPNGINLAYQYRLPKAIIPFIPQHHGTALMSYFFAKAKEKAAESAGAPAGTAVAADAARSVDERRFRHSGPKPQTREAAILMLADGVEASVRSLRSHEEPAIRAMVDRIIHERLEDRQFDECDITLRDIDRIREAFVAQLLGMYHRRIAYPQNKVVELESRRVAAGGSGGGGGGLVGGSRRGSSA